MPDRCPTCGSQVTIVSGGEGTSHYQPVAGLSAEHLRHAITDALVWIDGKAGTPMPETAAAILRAATGEGREETS